MTKVRLISAGLYIAALIAGFVAWHQSSIWLWAIANGIALTLAESLGEVRGYAKRSAEVKQLLDKFAAKWGVKR